jgi:hypothetical protein
MTSTLLPIIQQMHDATSDRERAAVLLAVSDAALMKYRPVFEDACRAAGFSMGLELISWRRAAWHAVRGPDGRHRNGDFEKVRAAVAAFAVGDEL